MDKLEVYMIIPYAAPGVGKSTLLERIKEGLEEQKVGVSIFPNDLFYILLSSYTEFSTSKARAVIAMMVSLIGYVFSGSGKKVLAIDKTHAFPKERFYSFAIPLLIKRVIQPTNSGDIEEKIEKIYKELFGEEIYPLKELVKTNYGFISNKKPSSIEIYPITFSVVPNKNCKEKFVDLLVKRRMNNPRGISMDKWEEIVTKRVDGLLRNTPGETFIEDLFFTQHKPNSYKIVLGCENMEQILNNWLEKIEKGIVGYILHKS